MSLTIDGQANSITSSTAGVNIPATVGTLSVGPSGSYMNVTSSGVGIGTLTPQTTLDVGGTIRNTPDKSSYIQVGRFSSAYGGAALSTAGGSTFLSLQVEGFEGLKIDSAGRVQHPNQPAFSATRTGGAFTNTGVGVFNATYFNIGGHYNTSTGRFTAPIAGTYIMTCAGLPNSTINSQFMYIMKNGSIYGASVYVINSDESVAATSIMNLLVNDYVEIYYNGGSEQIFCAFSGSFLA